MSDINEVRERLTEMANDYLPPATGWNRARDDLSALLADHARLQQSPTIDLERYAVAIQYAIDGMREAGGITNVKVADKLASLLARIDGQNGAGFPWENFPAYLIDKCEGDTISEEGIQAAVSAMAKDPRYVKQPAKGEGE